MSRYFLTFTIAVAVWGAFAASPVLLAQEDAFATEIEHEPTKKRPSIFRRPAEDSPVLQLAYANRLLEEGNAGKAMEEYRALVHAWHDTPEAAAAQQQYAGLLESKGSYKRAFDEFQYLIDNYSGYFPYEEAIEHQFRIANQVRTVRHGRFFFFSGFTTPESALPLYEKIVENAPNWRRAPEAQFFIAVIHEDGKDYELARAAYEVIQLRYPDSAFVAEASYRRAETLYRMAKSNARDEESGRRALSALAAFIRDYPGDPKVEAAREHLALIKSRLADMYFERAQFYDAVANRPKAAIIAYTDFVKNFPSSDLKAEATDRIEILQQEMENSE